MTQVIDVQANGTKVYKGFAPPTKITRDRDPAKAKYEFNNMVHNDFMYAPTEAARNAITQAFKSKLYEPAQKRGYLMTANVAKLGEDTRKAMGVTEGYGIWFQDHPVEESNKPATSVLVKAVDIK